MQETALQQKEHLKNLIPPSFARHNRLVPVRETPEFLEVGIHESTPRDYVHFLSLRLKRRVVARLLPEAEILERLQEGYGDSEGEAEEIIQDLSSLGDEDLAQDLEKMEDLLDSES